MSYTPPSCTRFEATHKTPLSAGCATTRLKPVSKSDRVRELAASGMSAIEIELQTGFSRQLVHKAMKPSRPLGRPRKLARCASCGRPIPSVSARA